MVHNRLPKLIREWGKIAPQNLNREPHKINF